MSAVEEVQAAIDKLTKLRDGSYTSPWEMEGRRLRSDGWILAEIAYPNTETTGALIVTLHAIIDEQLEVLEAAKFNMGVDSRLGHTHATVAAAIRFARKINGAEHS